MIAEHSPQLICPDLPQIIVAPFFSEFRQQEEIPDVGKNTCMSERAIDLQLQAIDWWLVPKVTAIS